MKTIAKEDIIYTLDVYPNICFIGRRRLKQACGSDPFQLRWICTRSHLFFDKTLLKNKKRARDPLCNMARTHCADIVPNKEEEAWTTFLLSRHRRGPTRSD